MTITPKSGSAQKNDAVFVPLTAVRTTGAGASVFVVEDGKAHQRSVTTGRITGKRIAVTKGLTGVDAIISDVASIENGDPVDVVSYDE